jgi:hypothetical protein
MNAGKVLGAPLAALIIGVTSISMAGASSLAPKGSTSGPLTAAVGQSMSVRLDAGGHAVGALDTDRLVATQLTVQGTGDGSLSIPLASAPIRILGAGAAPTYHDGEARYHFTGVKGSAEARAVSIMPASERAPLRVTAHFSLNGKPISATDLVGRSGALIATYTVTNTTTTTSTVHYTSVTGAPAVRTVTADQPYLVQAVTTLPQRFTGLNAGSASVGANGLGGNQAQWTLFPFMPISKTGTATFGWAANVTDAEIPKVTLQGVPVYVPASTGPSDGTDLSLPSLPGLHVRDGGLAAGLATAHAGAAQLVGGLVAAGQILGGAGSSSVTGLKTAISNVTTAIDQICAPTILNCKDLPSGGFSFNLTHAIAEVTQVQADVNAEIAAVETSGGRGPVVTKLQADLDTAVVGIKASAAVLGASIAALHGSDHLLDVASTSCTPPGCATAYQKQISDNKLQEAALFALALGLDALVPSLQNVHDELPSIAQGVEIGALNDASQVLTDVLTKLNGAATVAAEMAGPLAILSTGLAEIQAVISSDAAAIEQASGALPSITGGVATIASLSPGVHTYVAHLATLLRTDRAALVADAGQGKATATTLGQEVDATIASLHALDDQTHRSPLPFGGLTTAVPGQIPISSLTGAVQITLEPANTTTKASSARLVVGLVLMALVGFGVWGVTRRRTNNETKGVTP